MRRLLPFLLGCATALATAFPVLAQEAAPVAPAVPARSNCVAPDYSASGRMQWFLDINPQDNLEAVWCRIQQLPGNVRFNMLFPLTKANRSWDTNFKGGAYPPSRIVDLVQSLIPTGNGPIEDDKGMPFGRVLGNVVQLAAKTAPDNTPLGFASDHPAARQLVLWEPLVLRIRPVVLAGQQFTMKVVMKPNLGLLALTLQNPASDLKIRGWSGRMTVGSMFGSSCSDQIPFCKELGDMPDVHIPYLADEVILEADGEAMTPAAINVANALAASNARFIAQKSNLTNFNRDTGSALFRLDDGASEITYQATGGTSGTSKIVIDYKELVNNKYTVATSLKATAEAFRAGSAGGKPAAPVPDSLNKL